MDRVSRKAVCRDFASFRKQGKKFTLNDAVAYAEVEEKAKTVADFVEKSQVL